MYDQIKWEDRVTEYDDRYRETQNDDGTFTHTLVEGEVFQVGTPQNEKNWNRMEAGIQDVTLATQILAWANYHNQRREDEHEALMDDEVLGEAQEITLKNTLKAPFNSSVDAPTSVALKKNRKNLFYTVEAEVKEHVGVVGDIVISEKALNGFKIAYTGSGSSVTLTVRVKGGMT